MKDFDYSLNFKEINFRRNPELYQIGRGEQGVLLIEPYKSEILPHWKFKTPDIAKQSAEKIYSLFLEYKASHDFVGMDMARKFLQMGYTRARRYANHKTGRKYIRGTKIILPCEKDLIKAKSAEIFYEKWILAKSDLEYQKFADLHQKKYEHMSKNLEGNQNIKNAPFSD